ncbi:20S proteasome chaperone domain-containing protein [Ophiocordyceps camponoti-floridani]|uniref:20S proteasome chaperone domain-containing protein n=1 Tax=Ophiocordyceps camponoti-floridani TaxID=2030778 RepID=A0A8H4VE66_9HYPO|nr:20S proteasome chaperone domain-containing protein [Ophiocordyceps camponoti-floridani]
MAADEQSQLWQLSLSLPKIPETRIFIRLSKLARAVLISLTTATPNQVGAAKPMGSFVYALPNRQDGREPLSTVLFPHEPTLDLTTRLARLIARRAQLPTYVTNSMSFAEDGMGDAVDDEMSVFGGVAEAVLEQLDLPLMR